MKKPIYKKAWFWILAIILLIMLANSLGDKKESAVNNKMKPLN